MKTNNKGASRPKKIEKNAVVSHVESVSDLLVVWCYFPLNDDFLAVRAALETLKEQFQRGSINLSDLCLKDVREAEQDLVYLYVLDGVWYRCKIVEFLDQYAKTALARLVDVGKLCEINLRDLGYSADDTLHRVQPQAVKYVLDEVKPKESRGGWSEDILRFCHKTLLQQTVTLNVVGSAGEDLDLVVLYLSDSELHKSFNEILVEKDMASCCSSRSDEVSFWSLPPARGSQACYLVHRPTPTRLFLQVKKHRDEYNFVRMEEELNNPEEENLQLFTKLLNHGQPILAYNDEMFCNCRGLVSKMKNKEYLIYFVDYGNSELKSQDEIYVLPEKYLTIPVLAIECVLEDGAELKEVDENTELDCTFISDTKPYKVSLRLPTNTNIISSSMSYDPLRLEVGREYEVSVSFVKDIYEFYVRLKRFAKEYNLLQATLQLWVDKEESNSSLALCEAKTCVAFCSVEETWVRSLISFRSPFIAPVTHVDSGRADDMCTLDSLKPISEELVAMMPAQAIKCRLHSISPSSADPSFPAEQAKQVFLQLISKCSTLKARVTKVETEFAEVILVDDLDRMFSLNEKILFQVGANVARVIARPNLSRVESVFVTQFNSIRDFYCQLTRVSMEELHEFEEKLNQYGNAADPAGPPCLFKHPATDPAVNFSGVGQVCCAKYSADDRFYRGKVLSRHPLEADVLFVDYGNVETFELQRVKVLNAELAAKPQIGFACGAVETLRFETETEQMRAAVFNQTLEVEILKESPPGFYEIAFTHAPCNEQVLRLLQPNQTQAHHDKQPQHPHSKSYEVEPNAEQQFINLPFESKESATLVHLRSFRSFYFQFPKYQADLNNVTVNAQLAARHGEKFEGVIVRHTPCLAKFSFDDTWYRAIVQDLCPGDKYLVEFVDFGNRDEVPQSEIRQIPNHLIEIPKLALECCLFKHPDFEIPEDLLEEFESEALEKVFKVEFKNSGDQTPRVYVNFTEPSGIDLIDKYIKKAAAMNSQGGRSGTNSRGSNYGGGRNETEQRGGGRGNYDSPTWNAENAEPSSGGGGYRSVRSNNNFNSRGDNPTWGSNFVGGSGGNGGGNQRSREVPPRFQNQIREETPTIPFKSTPREESNVGNGRPFYQDVKKPEPENRTPNNYSANRGRNDSQNSSWSNEDKNTRNPGRDEQRSSGGGQNWHNTQDKRPDREDRSGGGQNWNNSQDKRPDREDRFGGERRTDKLPSMWNSSEDNRNGENKSRGFGGGGRDRSGYEDRSGASSRNENNQNSSFNRSENQRSSYNNRDDSRKPYENQRQPWNNKDESSPKPSWHNKDESQQKSSWNNKDESQQKSSWNNKDESQQKSSWNNKDDNQRPSYNRDRNAGGSNNFRSGNDSAPRWNRDAAPRQQQQQENASSSWNSPKTNAVEVSWESGPTAASAVAAPVSSAVTQVSAVKIEVGDFKEVNVVYAVTPEEFYCNLVDFKTQGLYRAMNEKLNKVCADESSCKKLDKCSVGAICAACFSEDQVWYRAKILSIDGTQATIMFIDYGNGDVCALDSLKVLEPELAKLPARAIKCSLLNVRPKGKEWSDEEADYFEGTVTKAHYYARFLAQNDAKDGFVIDMVDSFLYSDLSLRLQLMKQLDVVPRSTSDSVYAQLATTALKDQNAFTRLSGVEVGAKFKAYVSWVNFPGEFYARDLSAEAAWSVFDAKLNAVYAALSANELVLTQLEKGKPCVTPFTYNGTKAWYRALILAVENEHVVVAYVDFGNVERVEFHEVKTIQPEFTQLPAQALLLNLANLKPLGSHWKSVSQADLGRYLAGDLDCEVKAVGERTNEYVVDVNVGEKNVATRMIEDGLAYFEDGHCCSASDATQAVVEKILLSSQVKSVEAPAVTEIASPTVTPSGETSSLSSASPEIVVPASLEIVAPASSEIVVPASSEIVVPASSEILVPAAESVEPGIELGSSFEASVSFVNGLDSFYLQRTSDFGRLDDLSALLNSTFAESEPEEVMSWKVGEMCVARYEEDQAWYRALIREQQDFGFRLLFVDYGNIEFVTFDQIRSVPEAWSKVPYLASRCRLHGLREVSEQQQREAADAALNEILNGSESLEVAVKSIEDEKDSEKLFWVDVSCAGEDVAKEVREKCGIPVVVVDEKSEIDAKKSESEEVKVESEAIKPESVEKRSEIEEVKTESEAKKPEIEEKKPEVVEEKPEVVEEKPEVVEEKPEVVEEKPEVVEKKPEVVEKKPEVVEKKPEIVEKKPEIVEKKLEIVEKEPESVEVRSEIEEVKTESVKLVNAKATQCVLGAKVEVCVCFIDSPDRFWLQKVSDSQRLSTLLDELAASCSQLEEEGKAAGAMSVGDLYAVKFSEDDGWYRGEVESVGEDGGANVFFVDYGNCEAFEKGSARVQALAKDEWRETAFFAVQCKLKGDVVWSEAAREAFKSNYDNKTCLVEFLERKSETGVYEVRLLDMGLDVAQVIQPAAKEGEKDESSVSTSSGNQSSSAESSSASDESSKSVSSSSVGESVSSSTEDSVNESSLQAAGGNISSTSAVAVDDFNKSLVVPTYDEFAENAAVHPRSESPTDVLLVNKSGGGEVQDPSIESSSQEESKSDAALTKEAESVQPVSTSEKSQAAESFIAERLDDLDSKESLGKQEKVGDGDKLKNEEESDDSSTLENTSAGDLEVNSAELLKDEEPAVPVPE